MVDVSDLGTMRVGQAFIEAIQPFRAGYFRESESAIDISGDLPWRDLDFLSW